MLDVVFNDVMRIDRRTDKHFDASKRGQPFARVHSIDVERDLRLETVQMTGTRLGTTIAFGEELCARFSEKACGSHYLRFRIQFTEETRDLFGSEILPQDWWLVSSFQATEFIEFRLNERRSIPSSIVDWFERGPLVIHTIHYFLIRDGRYELVVQHRDFSKIRMLEADLWAPYLRGRGPEVRRDLDPIPSLEKDRLVIYHWKERTAVSDGVETGIPDFNAFAKFQSPRFSLKAYAAAIILLGALGSGLQAVAVFGVNNGMLPFFRRSTPTDIGWLDHLITLGLLALLVLLLPIGLAAFRKTRAAFGGWMKALWDRVLRKR